MVNVKKKILWVADFPSKGVSEKKTDSFFFFYLIYRYFDENIYTKVNNDCVNNDSYLAP